MGILHPQRPGGETSCTAPITSWAPQTRGRTIAFGSLAILSGLELAAPMERSSTQRAFASLFVATVVLAALGLLPRQRSDILFDAVLDAGHVPFFAVFTVLSWRAIRATGRFSAKATLALAFGVTAAIGALTECLQFFGPRNADPVDFGRDLLGALAGLLLVAARTHVPQADLRRRAGLGVAALLIVVVAMSPLVAVLRDCRARDAAFPVLLDFERRGELRFVRLRSTWLLRVPRPAPWTQGTDQRAGLVTFLPSEHPSLALHDLVADWSDFDRLRFDVVLPDTSSLELFVRIDDHEHDGRYGDRFDTRIALAPGMNRVSIELEDVRAAPRRRELDLSRVRSVVFFVERPTARVRLYLDAVRLERSERSETAARGPDRSASTSLRGDS